MFKVLGRLGILLSSSERRRWRSLCTLRIKFSIRGEVAGEKYSDSHFNTFHELNTRILVFDEINGLHHRAYLFIETLD